MKKIYITTSIPYVNGSPHLGHALELVQADCMIRAFKTASYDVYALTGTDENAQKNVVSALENGVTVSDFVTQNSLKFENLKNALNTSFNGFIRTTSQKHILGASKFFELCREDIYKKKYEGLYCLGCEAFYKDKELPDNYCVNHNMPLTTIQEENYFFKLSKYQYKLAEIIEKDTVKIFPEFRKTEILNFINKGLEDFSISRPTERMKNWGIEVPNDKSARMYVWFDALTNYLTGLDFYNDGKLYNSYWKNNPLRVHIVGKDIIKFHAIYWLAMLISAKQLLPTHEYVHGFITIDNQKMSKTLNNVIDPTTIIEKYGVDVLRYYLLSEIPALTDGDFSFTRLKQIYDSDLSNELGNLLMRLTTIAEKDFINIAHFEKNITPAIKLAQEYAFNEGIRSIWEEIKRINKEINDFAPWTKTAPERKDKIIDWLNKLNYIGYSLTPYMPETAEKILASTTGAIKKAQPLFPKI